MACEANTALQRVIQQAVREGWRATPTSGHRIKLEHPCGALAYTNSHTGDPRAARNLASTLRQRRAQRENRS